MRNVTILSIPLMCLCASWAYSIEKAPTGGYPLKPVPINKVKLEDDFWSPRLKTHLRVTIPYILEHLESTIENLRRKANIIQGRGGPEPSGRNNGLALNRTMEGVAYCLMIERNQELERKMDELISTIAEVQTEDRFHANPEGAVAYYLATGKDKWLRIAEESALFTQKEYFDKKGLPLKEPPAHGGIEMSLCRLYQGTGKEVYRDLAKKFLDMRGMPPEGRPNRRLWPKFAPQHKPVAMLNEPGGHAGSAGWFHCGLVDVSALTGYAEAGEAAKRIWQNMVDTRISITGGVGTHSGIEGFSPEYVLPNQWTYNETCAASGNVFFNHRLFLLTQDAKYFDVAEATLLNGALVGVSISGDRFFYVNPLEANGERKFNHGTPGRFAWFKVPCCPSSISRLIPQVPGYMYAYTDNEVYVTLYAGNSTEIPLSDGEVRIKQETKYPFDGRVILTVVPAHEGQRFMLKLRIPTWARERFMPGAIYSFVERPPNWEVRVNGQLVETKLEKGFAVIERRWKPGDRVRLDLPMPVQLNTCIEKVKANVGRVAVTRGPLLYCAEEVDNNGLVQRLAIPKLPGAEQIKVSTVQEGVLKGVRMIGFPAVEHLVGEERPSASQLVHSNDFYYWPPDILGEERPLTIHLVPYYSWDNRGGKSMIVWIPRSLRSSP